MSKIISKLPEDMVYEIISYLIEEDPTKVTFRRVPNKEIYPEPTMFYQNYSVKGYSEKYETGYCMYYNGGNHHYYDCIIMNKNVQSLRENGVKYIIGLSLSRIPKKKNNHRYYITKKETAIENNSHKEEEYDGFKVSYSSYYVGKNIMYALLLLHLSSSSQNTERFH